MKSNLILLMSGLLVLFTTNAFGQKLLTLEEAVAIGLEKNFDIRILKNDLAIASNENDPGRAGRLPTVVAASNWNNSLNYSKLSFLSGESQVAKNAYSSNLSASVEASYPIYDGGKARNQLELLGISELLAGNMLDLQSQNLISQIATAYYSLQLQQDFIKVLEEQVGFSNRRFELANVRKDLGVASGLDLFQSEIDLRSDSAELIRQKNIFELLKVNLFNIINTNVEDYSDIEFAPLSDTGTSPELAELEEIINTNNPELQLRKAELLQSETNINLAKSQQAPTLSVFGGVGGVYSESAVGFVSSNVGFNPYIGLNLRYPIFEGNVRKVNIQNAKIQYESSQLNVEKSRIELKNRLFGAYTNYINAMELMIIENKSIALAEKNLEVAMVSYEAGGISELELRNIQINLVNASYRSLSALKNANEERLNMYHIAGVLDRLFE